MIKSHWEEILHSEGLANYFITISLCLSTALAKLSKLDSVFPLKFLRIANKILVRIS